MPYASSGMWFTWEKDPQTGERYRDFRFDAAGRDQVDDRFEEKDGEFVQVRERVSYAPPGPPESWPDYEPDSVIH